MKFKKSMVGGGIAIALIGTALFRSSLSALMNLRVRDAGIPEHIPWLISAQTVLISAYYVGIVLLMVGIGRQVTWRAFFTFDMRNFEPARNFLYWLGFVMNRVGACFSIYILCYFWYIGKSAGPAVIGLSIFDVIASTIMTLKLTFWIKHFGTKRFQESSIS